MMHQYKCSNHAGMWQVVHEKTWELKHGAWRGVFPQVKLQVET
jgi:hypothetical protein